MKFKIIITADHNDGDCVTEVKPISLDQINQIEEILNIINSKDIKHLRWGTEDLLDDDNDPKLLYPELSKEQIDLLNNFVPTGDPNYPGIHTIEGIEIVTEHQKLI